MNISKSLFVSFCQCPKKLWLGTYRPELASEIDESLLELVSQRKEDYDHFRKLSVPRSHRRDRKSGHRSCKSFHKQRRDPGCDKNNQSGAETIYIFKNRYII